jgi:hypothetical protein
MARPEAPPFGSTVERAVSLGAKDRLSEEGKSYLNNLQREVTSVEVTSS